MRTRHQKLPGTGPKREALRQKGQFWTPDWVAEAMVAYVLAGGSEHVFDPAVGAGAFFRAAKKVAVEGGRLVTLSGAEVDGAALQEAQRNGISAADLAGVRSVDFVLQPPQESFDAIVANPPYIRHHRLSADVKAALRGFGGQLIGSPLDGRAGLHVYFLLRALQKLNPAGRLAFIMPADTCEGVFAAALWAWIARRYRIDAVVTFAAEASPFPGVDTNPIIFFIINEPPAGQLWWARCLEPETSQLKAWVASGFVEAGGALEVRSRSTSEALSTGLSRPAAQSSVGAPLLGDYVRVMRGIATGANEFYFLTTGRAAELQIPQEFLIPAIGRTRDVVGDAITSDDVNALAEKGKPTMLFSPDGQPLNSFPDSVRRYIEYGESLGINRKTLIATRRPWYKMERRAVPPFLFAYLGRRNARFIRNYAGVVPLTGFLCVYPHAQDDQFIERLWKVLRHPETIANLTRVGKSYGSGAIKVEPRALERLPLPSAALREVGLSFAPSPARQAQQTIQPLLPLG